MAVTSNEFVRWSVPDGLQIGVTKLDNRIGYCAVISSNGKFLASGTHGAYTDSCPIQIFDTTSGKRLAVMQGHKYAAFSSDFSSDSRFLATGDFEGVVYIWQTPQGKKVKRLKLCKGIVSVRFLNNEVLVVQGILDHRKTQNHTQVVYFYNLREDKVVGITLKETQDINKIAVSLDGKTLAYSNESGSIALWDIDKKTLLSKDVVDGSPEGERIFSFLTNDIIAIDKGADYRISQEGLLIFWSRKHKKVLAKIKVRGLGSSIAAFSSNLQAAATFSFQSEPVLWPLPQVIHP